MPQAVTSVRALALAILAAAVVTMSLMPDALAQGAGSGGSNGGFWAMLMQMQRDLTTAMTTAVRRLQTGDVVSSTAFLAFVSFLYGVLHAVGPGHGKFVISSYALANEQTVRRGIALSFMAAAIQAISAILLVVVATALLKATSVGMRATEAWLETVSWALIAGIGAWMLWRQARPLLPVSLVGGGTHGHAHAHDHAHHDHGHGHDHHDHAHHGHAHGSAAAAATCTTDHVHDEHCGHVHLPPPSALEGPWSWRDAWGIALSIGIRPCTGAILVLIFASSIGLFWAGVFATFAMAIGTAITVSALAAIAVGSRNWAARIAGADNVWSSRITSGAAIAGSLLVLAIGVSGFVVSLSGGTPL